MTKLLKSFTKATLIRKYKAKQHKKVLYANLLTSGKLKVYLADFYKQAEEMFIRLVKQMAEREGVTEQLKSEDQLVWLFE